MFQVLGSTKHEKWNKRGAGFRLKRSCGFVMFMRASKYCGVIREIGNRVPQFRGSDQRHLVSTDDAVGNKIARGFPHGRR